MKKGFKKEIWKLFYVASFLFITIFFILPYLVQVSTYFHEKGHQQWLSKYGIESDYKINLVETIPNFFNPYIRKLGVTKFNLNDYKKLDKFQKTNVNIAGTLSDLRFLFLIAIYLAMTNVYVYYKIKIKKDYNLTRVLAVNWILFMWLLALIQIIISNISFSFGDISLLIKYIGVG